MLKQLITDWIDRPNGNGLWWKLDKSDDLYYRSIQLVRVILGEVVNNNLQHVENVYSYSIVGDDVHWDSIDTLLTKYSKWSIYIGTIPQFPKQNV